MYKYIYIYTLAILLYLRGKVGFTQNCRFVSVPDMKQNQGQPWKPINLGIPRWKSRHICTLTTVDLTSYCMEKQSSFVYTASLSIRGEYPKFAMLVSARMENDETLRDFWVYFQTIRRFCKGSSQSAPSVPGDTYCNGLIQPVHNWAYPPYDEGYDASRGRARGHPSIQNSWLFVLG